MRKILDLLCNIQLDYCGRILSKRYENLAKILSVCILKHKIYSWNYGINSVNLMHTIITILYYKLHKIFILIITYLIDESILSKKMKLKRD